MAEATVESLLKRANMFLEDEEFQRADEYAERILDIDPECAQAYLIKLCCDFKVKNSASLGTLKEPFAANNNYKKIIRFGDSALKKEVKGYVTKAEENKKLADEDKKIEHALELAEFKRLEDIRKKYSVAAKMIAAGERHIVGLKSDGTVVAVGNNDYGQCNVSEWRDIIAVAAGRLHTVGLKADGTVVAVGFNKWRQCNVSEWQNITKIAAGSEHTVGTRMYDCSVGVAVGKGDKGQCGVHFWRAATAIAAGGEHTVGINYGGIAFAVGDNKYGQCNVSDWRDIVAVAAGKYHTVGLKKDGTVVATGNNEHYQCNVSHWRDIVAIAAGNDYTIGIKSDGSFIYFGSTFWDTKSLANLHDLIAITSGSGRAVGLKRDGMVVVADMNDYFNGQVSDWKLFDSVDTIEQEREIKMAEVKRQEDEKRNKEEGERRRKEEEERQEREARIQKLLREKAYFQTQLANLKGLFTGKRKKELTAKLQVIENRLKKLNYVETTNDSTDNSSTAKR